MKNLFIVLILLGFFSSCSKDDDPRILSDLIGRWVWVESTGGIDGRTETPIATGNQITIVFTSEFYKKYVNDTLDVQMTYKLKIGESFRLTENTNLLIYEDGWKQSMELCDNKLILYDECLDCFVNEYIKE